MSTALSTWIDAYRRTWDTNEPDDIRALFTEDAEYRTEPYVDPWRGHEQIIEGWLTNMEEPGSSTFNWTPLAITDDAQVVTATTIYPRQKLVFSNLWVIRFAADGRASEFTEWLIRQDGD